MPSENPVDSAAKKIDSSKHAHLKGRRRFVADFADIEEECKEGFSSCCLHVKKIRPGDEEGSFEVIIMNESQEHIISVILLISDTADYPKSHTFFCYSSDGNITPRLQEVIQEFDTETPRLIRDILLTLLSRISMAVGLRAPQSIYNNDYGEDTEEDEEENYIALSDDEEAYGSGNFTISTNHCDLSVLQHDFLEIVAADYRPGFIKHAFDNFDMSVSIPILRLMELIPPRALVAWDRAFLTKTQHLCLLISGFNGVYPVLTPDGVYTATAIRASANVQFKVGLTQRYKPGKEEARFKFRKHGLVLDEEEKDPQEELDPTEEVQILEQPLIIEEEENFDPNRFDSFSLSGSMEALMNQSFSKLVHYRLVYGLSWAGAEKLLDEVEKTQSTSEETLQRIYDDITEEDDYESENIKKTALLDPLRGLEKGTAINFPLTAFCYLIRRLAICPRYCLVCHRKLNAKYEALKPYVCDSKLCAYQYYAFNRGTPLEYEIVNNPTTVDLLVSFAYTGAVEGVLEEPPIGIALRVPPPIGGFVPAAQAGKYQGSTSVQIGKDRLCDFDKLALPEMRSTIVTLLDSLPSIYEMRVHLMKNVGLGQQKPKLQDIDLNVLPAAWLVLRWCVASCTAYLEEITNPNELVRGLDTSWRQFRFNVGSPGAEAEFTEAVKKAQEEDKRARQFPILYAFHGSPLRNWHSIIRHGLWFKTVAHGRAYGHGVYLAKDGCVSSSYANVGTSWSKSMVGPSTCFALVETVNLPHKFVSQNPYFVVDKTHWILCRYLLVRGRGIEYVGSKDSRIPFVKLDSSQPVTMNGTPVNVPEPSHKLEALLKARRLEFLEEHFDDDDQSVFSYSPEDKNNRDRIQGSASQSTATGIESSRVRCENDWKHDDEYVRKVVEHLLPPPEDSSISASMALQRELRSMVKEQDMTSNLKGLGWYMPLEFNENNLFQWIVEMHSFDPDLPISKDLDARKINSIIFEIRFPPTFPISPPFFRILKPRLLPFFRGGGGHVTAGGSICMDLLTADGWSPSYSISAVLMQIKLAISNTDPRPARLDPSQWNAPYQTGEALEGYLRAARTHGWRVPEGLQKLLYH